MTVQIQLDPASWTQIDTKDGDAWLDGVNFDVYIGTTAPTALSVPSHRVDSEKTIPQGVGLWVSGSGLLTVSIFKKI